MGNEKPYIFISFIVCLMILTWNVLSLVKRLKENITLDKDIKIHFSNFLTFVFFSIAVFAVYFAIYSGWLFYDYYEPVRDFVVFAILFRISIKVDQIHGKGSK